MHSIELCHTTDTGHRIPGHQGGQGKCARLHGHTYTFNVGCSAETLDTDGFVVDFGAVKSVLDEWDHRTLLWDNDRVRIADAYFDGDVKHPDFVKLEEETLGVIRVPFVPTAENMAEYLSFRFLAEFDQLVFVTVTVHETAKTAAKFYASQDDLARLVERSATR